MKLSLQDETNLGVAWISNQEFSFWAVGKEEDGLLFFMRRSREHGTMAAGMEGENDFRSRATFEANALLADGNPSIRTDLQRGAEAPNIRPPWAGRGWANDRTFFLFCHVPGALRGLFEFVVSFLSVPVEP